MAEYRSVQTAMWREDDWFQELEPDAKLFWIYLFTNPSGSVAGIYKLPVRTMANESGLPIEHVRELLRQFTEAGKIQYDNKTCTLWVCKMRDYQSPGIMSPKVLTRIDKDIAAIPYSPVKDAYLIRYAYPTDTLPIPALTETETDTDTETETETETDKKAAAVLAAAVKSYENTCGLISGARQRDEIVQAIEDLHGIGHPEWWDMALRIAEDNNACKWSYVRAIISSCLRDGRAPGSTKGKRNGSKPNVPQTAEERRAAYIPAGYEDLIEH